MWNIRKEYSKVYPAASKADADMKSYHRYPHNKKNENNTDNL